MLLFLEKCTHSFSFILLLATCSRVYVVFHFILALKGLGWTFYWLFGDGTEKEELIKLQQRNFWVHLQMSRFLSCLWKLDESQKKMKRHHQELNVGAKNTIEAALHSFKGASSE